MVADLRFEPRPDRSPATGSATASREPNVNKRSRTQRKSLNFQGSSGVEPRSGRGVAGSNPATPTSKISTFRLWAIAYGQRYGQRNALIARVAAGPVLCTHHISCFATQARRAEKPAGEQLCRGREATRRPPAPPRSRVDRRLPICSTDHDSRTATRWQTKALTVGCAPRAAMAAT